MWCTNYIFLTKRSFFFLLVDRDSSRNLNGRAHVNKSWPPLQYALWYTRWVFGFAGVINRRDVVAAIAPIRGVTIIVGTHVGNHRALRLRRCCGAIALQTTWVRDSYIARRRYIHGHCRHVANLGRRVVFPSRVYRRRCSCQLTIYTSISERCRSRQYTYR